MGRRQGGRSEVRSCPNQPRLPAISCHPPRFGTALLQLILSLRRSEERERELSVDTLKRSVLFV